MARKTKDEAQDIVLRQMEKVSKTATRKGERNSQDDYDSLASQLARESAYMKLSHNEKIARLPKRVWREKLASFLVKDCHITTDNTIKSLFSKRNEKFEEFQQNATSFTDILPYVQEELRKLF